MRVKLKKVSVTGRQHIKQATIVLVVVLVGGLGVYLLGGSHAASPYATADSANGTLSSAATTVTDNTANNGKAVQFGTATVTQTPLPNPGTWTNVTNNLSGLASQCGNLTTLSIVPNTDEIIAGVAGVGLFASTNDGASWSQLGTGSGSATVANRPLAIVYDPTNPGTFWEAGIYGNGLYKTTNNGSTFQELGTIQAVDDISVDFTDASRDTLLTDAHETADAVYKSTDGGQTWTNIGANLPTGIGFTSDPTILAPQTYIVNAWPSWSGGTPGIYRTTNGGTSWTKVSSLGPAGAPLVESNGTIYWADGNSMDKSTDDGVTWTQVGSNLYSTLVNTVTPAELPDGRLVTMNSSGSSLVVSADGGVTWTNFGATTPFGASLSSITTRLSAAVVYSPSNKAFFVGQYDCNNNVLSDAIEKLQ
jgi:photosystem II stability/assembly factor-like uncharacterized protein